MTDATNSQAETSANAQPQLAMGLQYIKDFSFENPNAPQTLLPGTAPQISVSVDVGARALGQDHYEVALRLKADAKREDSAVFVLEVVYAGLFQAVNFPADQLEPVLLIECPRLLFPFARRVVADATRDGGFPPLMLDPIDFVALYQQGKAQAAQSQAVGTA